MDITNALRRAVRSYAQGTEALAAQLGMSVTSLNHKVSPTYPGAHCSPEEAALICEITGDHGAAHAFAGQLGYVLLPAPRANDDHGQTMAALAATVREFGEFATRAATDMSDGTVTANELEGIEREGAEALAAINKLLAIAKGMHAASKPNLKAVA